MVILRHGMINNGQEPIFTVPYLPQSGASSRIEVRTIADLRRADPDQFAHPQRPDFHLVIAVRGGAVWHEVDFERYPLEQGDLLWVRPGQVQRWGPLADFEALVVLFTDELIEPALSGRDGPTRWRPGPGERAPVDGLLDLLATVSSGQMPTAEHVARHLLSALLWWPAVQAQPPTDTAGSETFRRYRAAVEEHFATVHDVAGYARMLGYSQRTLVRAVRAATGLGAKEFLDRRIVLDARRLLAHTSLPVSRISRRLGFAEAGNFTRFFRQRTGSLPQQFRADQRPSVS